MHLSICPLVTWYQYIAISKPTSRHLRDCSMLMRMLTMWSCFLPHLAGWFLVWLRLDVSMTCWSRSRSQFVIGLHQLCSFVVPRLFPTLEKRDKPPLTHINLKNSLRFRLVLRFPSKYDVCLRTNAYILSKCQVAYNSLKAVVYVVKL